MLERIACFLVPSECRCKVKCER